MFYISYKIDRDELLMNVNKFREKVTNIISSSVPYKEDDFIQIGTYKIIAKEKWEIDKKHIEFAKQKNYIIYEIWEHDIVSRNDNDLSQVIYNLLNN